MINNLIDCHVHTEHSFDSEVPLEQYCEKATVIGLAGLCVTDHCEVCTDGENKYWSFESMRASFEDAVSCGLQYADKLKVLAGVELGQPMHNLETTNKLLEMNDYDFILASVHYLRDGLDFYWLNYRTDCEPYDVYSRYLDDVLETVQWGGFDSLAHLSYPLRYMLRREKVSIELERFAGKYDEILSLLAEKGLALEINTNTAPDFPVPDYYLVKRFKELGGKLLTIGSDSHRLDSIGNAFEFSITSVKEAGFGELAYYVKRKPISVSLY